MDASLAPLIHDRRGARLSRPLPVGAGLAVQRHQDRLPVRVSFLLWVALAAAGWAVIGLVVLAFLGRL